MRFDPEGITTNPEIPFAKSMPDYIMRWLASRFLDADAQEDLGILTQEVRARQSAEEAATSVGDTAGPASTPATAVAIKPTAPSTTAAAAMTDNPPVLPADEGPRTRPGVLAVRRHDAAHGLLLHVLELRQQHRLRLIRGAIQA